VDVCGADLQVDVGDGGRQGRGCVGVKEVEGYDVGLIGRGADLDERSVVVCGPLKGGGAKLGTERAGCF